MCEALGVLPGATEVVVGAGCFGVIGDDGTAHLSAIIAKEHEQSALTFVSTPHELRALVLELDRPPNAIRHPYASWSLRFMCHLLRMQ